METRVLEINLISAQDLKAPSANLRRMQTYALIWVDPSTKLRSRVDRIGGENPTWNDKFLFRVSLEFLSGETSGISVEIYAVGVLRDHLIGTARFLISNLISSSTAAAAATSARTPFFTALHIRRASGKFQGVLNLGAMVIDGCDFAALGGVSAVGYRDLMGKSMQLRRHPDWMRKSKSKSIAEDIGGDSCENSSCADSGDYSDGADSTTSSSSTASTALKEWNGIRNFAGNYVRSSSDGGGLLCGLLMQKKK